MHNQRQRKLLVPKRQGVFQRPKGIQSDGELFRDQKNTERDVVLFIGQMGMYTSRIVINLLQSQFYTVQTKDLPPKLCCRTVNGG